MEDRHEKFGGGLLKKVITWIWLEITKNEIINKNIGTSSCDWSWRGSLISNEVEFFCFVLALASCRWGGIYLFYFIFCGMLIMVCNARQNDGQREEEHIDRQKSGSDQTCLVCPSHYNFLKQSDCKVWQKRLYSIVTPKTCIYIFNILGPKFSFM